MHAARVHIDPIAHAVGRFLAPLLDIFVFRIRDGELAAENDMSRESRVRVRRVVWKNVSSLSFACSWYSQGSLMTTRPVTRGDEARDLAAFTVTHAHMVRQSR